MGSPKRFNLITNIFNQAGLQRDYELLRRLLEARGHACFGVMFDDQKSLPQHVDINVYLEVVAPHTLPYAKTSWIVPNSEWYWPHAWDQFLPRMEKVLCKTHDCYNIWSKKIGRERCVSWMGVRRLFDVGCSARKEVFSLCWQERN